MLVASYFSNSLYKAELVYGPEQGPWKTVADLELATLGWVHWFNNQRLHGYLGDIPPAEYEDTYHAERSIKQPVGNRWSGSIGSDSVTLTWNSIFNRWSGTGPRSAAALIPILEIP